MRIFCCLIFLLALGNSFAQQNLPTNFTYHSIVYKKDSVHILLYQKQGDDKKQKPLFLFIQGSLPVPLMVTEDDYMYGVFPFNPDSLSTQCHIAIVGKPGIPLTADVNELQTDMTYFDPVTKVAPSSFSQNDYPNYYAGRESEVIKYLQEMDFIAKNKLVVAGHSAGATIATNLAVKNKKVTHLIYAAGNPYGRIVSMVASARKNETDTSSLTEGIFKYWDRLSNGNPGPYSDYISPKISMVGWSKPMVKDLLKLKIPVLVVYGGKDLSAPYNDLLRIEAIRNWNYKISFHCYPGLEHNFFGMKEDGSVNYDNFNWDKVASDWNKWLMKTNK